MTENSSLTKSIVLIGIYRIVLIGLYRVVLTGIYIQHSLRQIARSFNTALSANMAAQSVPIEGLVDK